MFDNFIDDIKNIYNQILSGQNPDIAALKDKWQAKTSLGEVYQSLCKRELKKELGSFYTPYEVVDFMVGDALSQVNLEENPNIKILDPSCGGGYFLLAALQCLSKKTGGKNLESIVQKNLYGFDIDENAVMITTIELYERTGRVFTNLKCRDFLLEDDESYDIILGNPPYMGHKVLTGEYRTRLYELYGEVFSDKGDLSYCFIKKAIESLGPHGILSFFTSRYLLEALNARDIRRFIRDAGSFRLFIDFYGVRVVKGAGVDNIILSLEKGGQEEAFDFFRLKERAKGRGKVVFEDIGSRGELYSRHIKMNRQELDERGWSFLSPLENSVLEKIRGLELGVICESFQGIITGCDEAFILPREEAKNSKIEEGLLKPWIKSRNIQAFSVLPAEELIIYSDLIQNEDSSSEALEYIGCCRERLEGRRECLRGLRKWYGLQWGRRPNLFEGEKIIYPYKSSRNRFAVDRGNYFSADVYGMKIREMFENQYTYEYLAGILNSRIYEFYIKSMAKKLGEDLYEYYPNRIMTLRIPPFIREIHQEVEGRGENLKSRIENILIDYFGITSLEYDAILEWVREEK